MCLCGARRLCCIQKALKQCWFSTMRDAAVQWNLPLARAFYALICRFEWPGVVSPWSIHAYCCVAKVVLAPRIIDNAVILRYLSRERLVGVPPGDFARYRFGSCAGHCNFTPPCSMLLLRSPNRRLARRAEDIYDFLPREIFSCTNQRV